MWQLCRGILALFCPSRFTERRPFWQLAPATTPQNCGAFHLTARRRLVWQLCRGTAAVFVLSRFTERRLFWQPSLTTRLQNCGAFHLTARRRLVWQLCRGMTPLCCLSRFTERRPLWQPALTTRLQNCGADEDHSSSLVIMPLPMPCSISSPPCKMILVKFPMHAPEQMGGRCC